MAALLGVVAAGRELGVGRTKTYELIGAGELETVRIGRRVLVPRESIDAYVARLRAEKGR